MLTSLRCGELRKWSATYAGRMFSSSTLFSDAIVSTSSFSILNFLLQMKSSLDVISIFDRQQIARNRVYDLFSIRHKLMSIHPRIYQRYIIMNSDVPLTVSFAY